MSRRKPIPARLRHEVFRRDGYRCRECGATNKETTLEIDHIVPVSKGGGNNLSNLQTLCKACNRAKHTRTWVGGVKDNPPKKEIHQEVKTDWTARMYAEKYWEYVEKGDEEVKSLLGSRTTALSYYKQAIEYHEKYYNYVSKIGKHKIDYKEPPKSQNKLPDNSIQNCINIHRGYERSAISKNDKETKKGYESVLNETGNRNKVLTNKKEVQEKKTEDRIKYLHRRYFDKIKSGNENAEKAKNYLDYKRSIRSYKKAIEAHEEYFNSRYKIYDPKNYKKMPQPPERLTNDAIKNLLLLYKKTHSLKNSSERVLKINSEISEILMGLHEDKLKNADEELKKQIHQEEIEKKRIREERIEKIENAVGETYAMAQIAANKIGNLFKK